MKVSKSKIWLLAITNLIPIFCTAQTISTIAGSGNRGHEGNEIPATTAELWQPGRVAVDDSGNVYIVDYGNNNIRKVSADGTISIVAGDRNEEGSPGIRDVSPCYKPDGVPATASMVWKPRGIAVDHRGSVYFTEECDGIRMIDRDGIIKTVAYTLRHPEGIAIDRENNIYYASDMFGGSVQKISAADTAVIIAGCGIKGYGGDGGPATNACLNNPTGVAVDDSGSVYFSDNGNECVRKVNSEGIITTIAGTGSKGYTGDNGPATQATLNDPIGIACDHYGNIYIADARNDAIRRVDANGIITTFAGNGKRLYHGDDGIKSSISYARSQGNAGDGGPATAAQLYWPMDVALDRNGGLYIADDQHHTVRKVIVPDQPRKEIPKKDRSPGEAFSISADPGKQVLTITIDPGSYTSFAITDTAHKVLIEQPIKSIQTNVDISSLLPANYYINLKKDDQVKTAMFVKEN